MSTTTSVSSRRTAATTAAASVNNSSVAANRSAAGASSKASSSNRTASARILQADGGHNNNNSSDDENGNPFLVQPKNSNDQKMTGSERMFHVYEALTDIEHALERSRHFLQARSNTVGTENDSIEQVLATVRSALPTLWGSEKVGSKKPAARAGLPRVNRERFAQVEKLIPVVQGVVTQQQQQQLRSNNGPTGSLLLQCLDSILAALTDAQLLLNPEQWRALPSRSNKMHAAVSKMCSHFVDDFNALIRTQLPLMLQEAFNEGATLFTSAVKAGATGAAAAGAASSSSHLFAGIIPMDVVVGVMPIRCLTPSLLNAQRLFDLALRRVADEKQLLEEICRRERISTIHQDIDGRVVPQQQQLPSSAAGGEKERTRRRILQDQFIAVDHLLDAINAMKGDLSKLSAEWADAENEALQRAMQQMQSNNNDQTVDRLRGVRAFKALKESNIARALETLVGRLNVAAFQFLSPQYCRRRSLTYAQPCSVRIALRAVNTAPHTASATVVDNFHPAALTTNLGQIAPDLLPTSQHAMWIPFDNFPEMVCSERCVLDTAIAKPASSSSSLHGQQHGDDNDDAITIDAAGVEQQRDPTSSNTVCTELTNVMRAAALEEQREVGGFFIAGGNERLLRMLQVQRSNIGINIERARFAAAGFNFLPKSVVFRSRRPSGLTMANILYATRAGDAIFCFTRKTPWNIPCTVLLCACKAVTPTELIGTLSLGGDDETRNRAEVLVQHHKNKSYGSYTHPLQFLALIGRLYCHYQVSRGAGGIRFIPEIGSFDTTTTFGSAAAAQAAAAAAQNKDDAAARLGNTNGDRIHHDAWYGLFVVRRHVLPHLNNVEAKTPDALRGAPLDPSWPGAAIKTELSAKFDCIAQLVRQLHGFVGGHSCHQGNDCPSFHEVFAPSQLLAAVFETCVFRVCKISAMRLGNVLSPTLIKDLLAARQHQLNGQVTSVDVERTLQKLRTFMVHSLSSGGGGGGVMATVAAASSSSAAAAAVPNAANVAGANAGIVATTTTVAQSEGFLDAMRRVLTTGTFDMGRDEDFFTPQNTGWSVMVERLNFYRFFEQLRTVHRGSKIAEMRSAEVRKYPADAFGFLCMVHSPDGTDCGVVNFLTTSAEISTPISARGAQLLEELVRSEPDFGPASAPAWRLGGSPLPVWIEGRVAGFISEKGARSVECKVRAQKLYPVGVSTDTATASPLLGQVEVVLVAQEPAPIPRDDVACPVEAVQQRQPRGLYLFTGAGRFLRPVREVRTSREIKIGTWEQMWMDIAGVPSDITDACRDVGQAFGYIERTGADLISFTSNTIPFFHHNCLGKDMELLTDKGFKSYDWVKAQWDSPSLRPELKVATFYYSREVQVQQQLVTEAHADSLQSIKYETPTLFVDNPGAPQDKMYVVELRSEEERDEALISLQITGGHHVLWQSNNQQSTMCWHKETLDEVRRGTQQGAVFMPSRPCHGLDPSDAVELEDLIKGLGFDIHALVPAFCTASAGIKPLLPAQDEKLNVQEEPMSPKRAALPKKLGQCRRRRNSDNDSEDQDDATKNQSSSDSDCDTRNNNDGENVMANPRTSLMSSDGANNNNHDDVDISNKSVENREEEDEDGVPSKEDLRVDFLKLFGFWLGNSSSMNPQKEGGQVTFVQSKITDVIFIRVALKRLGLVEKRGSEGEVIKPDTCDDIDEDRSNDNNNNDNKNSADHDAGVEDENEVAEERFDFFIDHDKNIDAVVINIRNRAWVEFFFSQSNANAEAHRDRADANTSKWLPPWAFNLGIHHARALLWGLREADGNATAGAGARELSGAVYTSSQHFRDQLVRFLLHCGKAAHWREAYGAGSDRGQIAGLSPQVFAVSANYAVVYSESLHKCARTDIKEVQGYNDGAWCVTVPSGNIIVRRRVDAASNRAWRPVIVGNCSPRNLFQCGLSKQTCGTQVQSQAWRKDAKLFRVMSPQRYLVRTRTMDRLGLDDFSLGVNAVVAVLSYTGYDMDDAVIVNRSAIERGMFHAMITVTKIVGHDSAADSKSKKKRETEGVLVFHNLDAGSRQKVCPDLDEHGFPPKRTYYGSAAGAGAAAAAANRALEAAGGADSGSAAADQRAGDHSQPSMTEETPLYCTARRFERKDPATGQIRYEYTKHHVKRWRDLDKGENGWVHNVVPLAYDGPDVTQALFVFRIPRNPAVGDKFSSRHGQKGTLPLLIPHYDLPFSAAGIVPDVIINPHAFPSRMTVGMILELLAGKLCAARGRFYDNSAWSVVDETPVAAEDIGQRLIDSGMQYHGREQLYCGTTGEPMVTDVFMGVCGYQRLRHMVNDKWQARAKTDQHTHRAVSRTGQPVKGRKRHGGVRVGEMERDGLLSHGVTEVILDRFMHVSDQTKAFLCTRCGGMATIYEANSTDLSTTKLCTFCDGADPQEALAAGAAYMAEADQSVILIDIPQVLRTFVSELMGIGVRVSFKMRT